MLKRVFVALLLSTAAFAADTATLKGVVVDPAGAVVQNARIRVVDKNGQSAGEAITNANGNFEVTTPVGNVTLTVIASGFDRFQKELNVAPATMTSIEVKLTLGCSEELAQIIPKKLDLRHFLVEIHYWSSFGDCPNKIYRLWGTGEASIAYEGCGGINYATNRFIEPAILETALAKIAKDNAGPACSYYPGGIDAPRVELTIFSGSEPRLVVSHDTGEDIENVTRLEQQLKKLIDPEHRMKSFDEQATSRRNATPGK